MTAHDHGLHDPDAARLRAELEAVPQAGRLDFLAALPPERRVQFKRILPRADIRRLNDHIDRAKRRRALPTHAEWIAEARAGRATAPDAMVEALQERRDQLRPGDAAWISRIAATAAGGSYSKRQEAVIRAIYERYFVARGAD